VNRAIGAAGGLRIPLVIVGIEKRETSAEEKKHEGFDGKEERGG